MLNNYAKKCKSTLGGIKRAYLMKFADYDETEVITSGDLLTSFPSTYVYKIECVGNFSQQSTYDAGLDIYNQSISIKLPILYGEIDSRSFKNTKFRVVIETNNADLLIFGLFNGLDCTLSNDSGGEKTEFNGFTLNFVGQEEDAAPYFDEIADFFFEFETSEFDYILNSIL